MVLTRAVLLLSFLLLIFIFRIHADRKFSRAASNGEKRDFSVRKFDLPYIIERKLRFATFPGNRALNYSPMLAKLESSDKSE